MSILSLDIAVPAAQAFSAAVRPLIGVGIFATLFMLFKPLINGALRAGWLLITPRKSLEERKAERKFQGWMMLNRLAREYQSSQPGLAAELRAIAARDDR